MHIFKVEATKFTLVGAANFVLTFIVFTVMLKVLEVNYLISLVAAWIVGMTFSYILNFSWVFKPEKKIQFGGRFAKFAISSSFSITLNMVVLYLIVERAELDPFYVQMSLIPFVVILNFILAKYWSLKLSENAAREIVQVKSIESNVVDSIWRVESLSKLVFIFCGITVTAYCFWTLDRGFDITDEAYYLLLAKHSTSVEAFISAQQWITGGLWFLTGSLASFRGVGMLLILVSSTLIAIAAFSTSIKLELVIDSHFSKIAVVSGSIVCGLLYASTINLSPSYNLIASIGAYTAAGLTLFATNNTDRRYKFVLFALAGCALSVEFLAKPSSGLSTLLILIFWIFVFESNSFFRLLGSVVVVFCAAFFIGVLLLFNTEISDATQSFELGMQLFKMVQTESIWSRLTRYLVDTWSAFQVMGTAFIIPIVAMIVYAVTRRLLFALIGLTALTIILLFGTLVGEESIVLVENITSESYFYGGYTRYVIQITAVVAMLLMALIVTSTSWYAKWHRLALITGLLLLPYSVAMGSGNALFTQVIVSMAPWGVLVPLLVVARHSESLSKVPSSLLGLLFIVTISLQIITSNSRPYHLSSPLTEQDEPIAIGSLGKVRVDADTLAFINDIEIAKEKCQISSGAFFIGLYNIPGIALTLDAIPLVSPWWNNKEQAEFIMERVAPEQLRSALVVIRLINKAVYSSEQNLVYKSVPPALPKQLSNYKQSHRYCGSAVYPYHHQRVEIWQPLP